MNKFHFKFDKKQDLGKNFLIYENSHKSCICNCGYYNEKLHGKPTECPNCKTKAIISVCCTNPNTYSDRKNYLNYLEFSNDGFKLECDKIHFSFKLKTVVVNNIPEYVIVEDSLTVIAEEWVRLNIFYTTNNKNKRVLKSEYYVNKEKTRLLSSNCISLYSVLFINDKISDELRKIGMSRYSSYDVWKIYSFYKNAPDLIRDGYLNFSGSVSEIREFNNIYIREKIKPVFSKMLEQFRAVIWNNRLHSTINYCDFELLYAKKDDYYSPAVYDNDFMLYVLSLDNELLADVHNDIRNISALLRLLYELKFNTEETNNFLSLALRQKASLYELCEERTLIAVKLFNKYGVKIDKNIKDIRIFVSKITLLPKFNTYVYTNTMEVLNNRSLSRKKLRYEDKAKAIIKFLVDNKYDFFPALVNLSIEKNEKNTEYATLYKDNEEIENCLLILNQKDEILRILYEDKIYETKEDIDRFLTEIEEQKLCNAI